jgi:hypothetical protein
MSKLNNSALINANELGSSLFITEAASTIKYNNHPTQVFN